MKTSYVFLAFLLFGFLVLDVCAQDSTKAAFRKIDLNVNFNINGKTNYSESNINSPKALQAIFTFYPLQFRKVQMGFSLGYEKMESSSRDSVTTLENRIPLLATAKINLSAAQAVYFRAQLGTALIASSYSTKDEVTDYNYREDIGAPLIFSLGLGINIPLSSLGVGFELGYSYKQLGYKRVNDYQNGAFYLGLSISFP